ncbi:MAG: hypothetical protein WC716_15260 [Chitinophagaceae bacterium]|jgi:hypothetical protein
MMPDLTVRGMPTDWQMYACVLRMIVSACLVNGNNGRRDSSPCRAENDYIEAETNYGQAKTNYCRAEINYCQAEINYRRFFDEIFPPRGIN